MVQDKSAISRMLRTHGLPGLDNAHGLLAALASRVTGHEHLRSLLIRCEPENRSAMYDSLKPYLRFQARPLDTYIAESAERAERQKLPTIDADGELHWAKMAPEVKAEPGAANPARTLAVACRSCAKREIFTGETKYDAVANARLNGWVYYEDANGNAQQICPDCPATAKPSPICSHDAGREARDAVSA